MFLPLARLLYSPDGFRKRSVDLRCRSVKVNTARETLRTISGCGFIEIGKSMTSQTGLVERAAAVFGGTSRIMIEGNKADKTLRIHAAGTIGNKVAEEASSPPSPQIFSGSEGFPLHSDIMMLPLTGSSGTGDLVGPREDLQAGSAGLGMSCDADILRVLQNLVGLFRPVSSTGTQPVTRTAVGTATTLGTSFLSIDASSDQANDDNDVSMERPQHIPTVQPDIIYNRS